MKEVLPNLLAYAPAVYMGLLAGAMLAEPAPLVVSHARSNYSRYRCRVSTLPSPMKCYRASNLPGPMKMSPALMLLTGGFVAKQAMDCSRGSR